VARSGKFTARAEPSREFEYTTGELHAGQVPGATAKTHTGALLHDAKRIDFPDSSSSSSSVPRRWRQKTVFTRLQREKVDFEGARSDLLAFEWYNIPGSTPRHVEEDAASHRSELPGVTLLAEPQELVFCDCNSILRVHENSNRR
jgi:hypothetical protein